MADSVTLGSDSRGFVVNPTEAPPEEAPPIPWWLIALGIGAGAIVIGAVVATRK